MQKAMLRLNNKEYHISRLVDVRMWTASEISEFLIVCGHKEHLDLFWKHNLKGKRLEFIGRDLLVYCGIPKEDAQDIVDLKSFFIEWLSCICC